jgi:hypothetical protein
MKLVWFDQSDPKFKALANGSSGQVLAMSDASTFGWMTPPTAPLIEDFTVDTTEGGTDTQVKFLDHFDGSGTQFVDEVGHTVTTNSATQTTSRKKFGTGSGRFEIGDYVKSVSSDYSTNGGDFTADAWVYLDSGLSTSVAVMAFTGGDDGSGGWHQLYCRTDGSIYYQSSIPNGQVFTSAASLFPFATWFHLALVRHGTLCSGYINGTLAASGNTAGAYSAIDRLWLFSDSAAAPAAGNLDEFRLIVGRAVWTTNFTPKSVAYSTNIDVPRQTFTLANPFTSLTRLEVLHKGVQLREDVGFTRNVGGQTITIIPATAEGDWVRIKEG